MFLSFMRALACFEIKISIKASFGQLTVKSISFTISPGEIESPLFEAKKEHGMKKENSDHEAAVFLP